MRRRLLKSSVGPNPTLSSTFMNPRDSNHPMWDGAEFNELDASFSYMVSKRRDVLIFDTVGNDSPGFPMLITHHQFDKILNSAMKTFLESKASG